MTVKVQYILCLLYAIPVMSRCKSRMDCSFHGDCTNGRCQCDDGWKGYSCIIRTGDRNCGHGAYSNATDSCVCNDHWKTSGFTDTVNWLDGTCNQFECQSNSQCQELTGLSGAKCPIKNWNCYCGLSHAGFKTSNVKCMTGIYAFSFSAFYAYKIACREYIWKIAILLSILSLPFGMSRRECDHHRSWIYRYIKKSSCDGSCVHDRKWKLSNDLALSLYWLTVGAWWYGFLTLIGATLFFIWCVIIWILAIIACIAAICTSCKDNNNSNNDNCCDCCNDSDCSVCCTDNYGYVRYHNNVNIIYIGGPSPNNCCDCDCCSKIFSPLGWMIKSYPTFPQNLHGGVVGYLMGTHCTQSKDRALRCTTIANFMSLRWMHSTDLRNNDRWRNTVRQHVRNDRQNPISQHIHRPSNKLLPHPPVNMDQSLLVASRSIRGSTVVETINNDIPSEVKIWNRDHYCKNECWICNESSSTWHLWKHCNHAYCDSCSNEMLDRKMPCPLCRQIPDIVRSYNSGV
jgi:hypothetical protein